MEDYVLQKRCDKIGLIIDRSQFYPIGSPEILQLFDGVSRFINKKDPSRAKIDKGYNGLTTISQLTFAIDKEAESANPLDNVYVTNNDRVYIVNIASFETIVPLENESFFQYDLRQPQEQISHTTKSATANPMTFKDDWTNIPYYPTVEDKKEQQQRQQRQQQQYQNNSRPFIHHQQHPQQQRQQTHQQPQQQPQQQYRQQQQQRSNPAVAQILNNKYSPYYAQAKGIQPRAMASANIGLGGIIKF